MIHCGWQEKCLTPLFLHMVINIRLSNSECPVIAADQRFNDILVLFAGIFLNLHMLIQTNQSRNDGGQPRSEEIP
ncbi:MAG: hypothetical protein HOD90_04705 [Nitrospina sp.]|nr:hypothetical protein [Nitrospina sp.]